MRAASYSKATHATLSEINFDDSAPLDAAKVLLRRREKARQVEVKRQERDQSLVDLATERASPVRSGSMPRARRT